jgi:tagatose 1,6-diphosphate aldolase
VTGSLRSQIGRRRRLDALSGGRGIFAVAAIDHRDALSAAHAKAGLPAPARDDVLRFKAAVVRALAPHATGVMLDPDGGSLALAEGAPGGGPVVMPLEAQGYADVESGRVTSFLPGWSPARAL